MIHSAAAAVMMLTRLRMIQGHRPWISAKSENVERYLAVWFFSVSHGGIRYFIWNRSVYGLWQIHAGWRARGYARADALADTRGLTHSRIRADWHTHSIEWPARIRHKSLTNSLYWIVYWTLDPESWVSDPGVKYRIKPTHRVTFSMGHAVMFSMGYAGANRESHNDTPRETPSLRLSRPISAPLLTAIQGTCRYLHHCW